MTSYWLPPEHYVICRQVVDLFFETGAWDGVGGLQCEDRRDSGVNPLIQIEKGLGLQFRDGLLASIWTPLGAWDFRGPHAYSRSAQAAFNHRFLWRNIEQVRLFDEMPDDTDGLVYGLLEFKGVRLPRTEVKRRSPFVPSETAAHEWDLMTRLYNEFHRPEE